MITTLCLLVGLGVIALIPYWMEQSKAAIDRTYRAKAPGQFVELSQGVTHFQWQGAARGPVLVAIHGLTTPSRVWDSLAHHFGLLGYRVLTYDLYGRGFSDAPSGLQDGAFFATQLEDLLQSQGVDETVSLVGYSMGGSIALSFAAQNTHLVDRVFLIASAGFDVTESRFSHFCRRVPVVGDWIHGVFAGRRMSRAILAEDVQPDVVDIKDVQLAELTRQGFLRSVLSSRRGLLAQSMETNVRALAKRNVPVLAVWAEDDPVIPVTSVGKLAEWHRGAQQDVIKQADHSVAYTHGDFIIDAFETMLNDAD